MKKKYKIFSPGQFKLKSPVENGKSFKENSLIKAKNFSIKKGENKLYIKSFEVNHGLINATGYVMEKIGYSLVPRPKKMILYMKIKFQILLKNYQISTQHSLEKEE